MHLATYTYIGTAIKGGRALELEIHHNKRRVPACRKMQIAVNIAKSTIQHGVPLFSTRIYTNKAVLFIVKPEHCSFSFTVHAVNGMYDFIQVMHGFVINLPMSILCQVSKLL